MVGRKVIGDARPPNTRAGSPATGQPGMVQQGFALFRSSGCSGCHDAGSTVHAPLLQGLYGRTVQLQDGRHVVADENYLRDSILLPRKDVVAGFDPVMPSYAGQFDEEQLQQLVAYLCAGAPAHPTSEDLR